MGRRNKTSWVVVAMPVEGITQEAADELALTYANALGTLLNEYARITYGENLPELLRFVEHEDD